MDIPNFKVILQKLSVFKNNLSLLVPVIIALVSVILFVPTQLMSSKLREQITQDSVRNGGDRVRRLEGRAVSSEQYAMEVERQKAHANDANDIANLAVQSTQRALLTYTIFPEPDPNGFSGLIFQEFGQHFRNGINERIVSVNGRDCPTDAELERGLENSSAQSRVRMGGLSMGPSINMSRSPYGGMMMPGGIGSIQRMIIDEMCQARAKSISVYVNPIDLSGFEFWAEYKYDATKEEAVEDCWYHQLAYWVIEDILDTISSMNSGYDNVLAAPVKRFLNISFTMGLKSSRMSHGVFRGRGSRTSTDTKRENADKPKYVITSKDGLAESCTGRYSKVDGDIDVTHFNVSVVVAAKSVLPFMQKLCSAKQHKFNGYPYGLEQSQTFKHNQISILESKVGSVDPDDQLHKLYRYGEDSVVVLDLICEYIFNKEGYQEIIPESVKKTLAGEGETTRR